MQALILPTISHINRFNVILGAWLVWYWHQDFWLMSSVSSILPKKNEVLEIYGWDQTIATLPARINPGYWLFWMSLSINQDRRKSFTDESVACMSAFPLFMQTGCERAPSNLWGEGKEGEVDLAKKGAENWGKTACLLHWWLRTCFHNSSSMLS